jgi:uncharacterized protein
MGSPFQIAFARKFTHRVKMENEKDLTSGDADFVETHIAGESSIAPEGDKTMAMLCHLLSLIGFIGVPLGNIVGPLILWLVKKDGDAFVDATGREVLNFQISATIYGIVCALLFIVFVGIILLPILIIAVIIYTIIGAVKANEGQLYRYPLTIRFLK